MNFGEILTHFRKEREYSIRELARLVEIDPGYISRLESGEKEFPSEDVIRGLRKALKLSDRKGEIFEALTQGPLPDALITLCLSDISVSIEDAKSAATISNRGARPLTESDWAKIVSQIAKIRVSLENDS